MNPPKPGIAVLPMYRQVFLLATAQALFQIASVLVMTIGGLAGALLAPAPEWATAPIAAMFLGTAASTVPASMWMTRVGRRLGFLAGAFLGSVGGLVAAAGMVTSSLLLVCAGTFLVGAYQGFAQFYRFAASEVASDAFKARARSFVLAGGVVHHHDILAIHHQLADAVERHVLARVRVVEPAVGVFLYGSRHGHGLLRNGFLPCRILTRFLQPQINLICFVAVAKKRAATGTVAAHEGGIASLKFDAQGGIGRQALQAAFLCTRLSATAPAAASWAARAISAYSWVRFASFSPKARVFAICLPT